MIASSLPDFDVFESYSSWDILRVKTGFEAKVAEVLLRHGVICWRGTYQKTKTKQAELFPGYLFINKLDESPIKIVEIPYCMGFLRYNGQRAKISGYEMESMRRILESGEVIIPWRQLVPGEPVKIVKGSMAGLEALFATVKGDGRVVVNLPGMNRALTVVVPEDWVESIKKSNVG